MCISTLYTMLMLNIINMIRVLGQHGIFIGHVYIQKDRKIYTYI